MAEGGFRVGLARSSYAPHVTSRDDVLTTRLDYLIGQLRKYTVNWSRRSSLWPMPFATACCGIELMSTGASRYDIARFGAEAMRFTPRQCDLMIVAGTLTKKMAGPARKVYDQMPNPKWVIAMGACASSGGMYGTYSTVQGCDSIFPVDIYLPGCPPRPEALINGIIQLQKQITQGRPSASERAELAAQAAVSPARIPA